MRALRALPLMTAVFAVSAGAAEANGVTPAWQEPGYVMEEIVVTAPAAAEITVVPAAPELYMDEVVVKARVPLRLAQFLALHESVR